MTKSTDPITTGKAVIEAEAKALSELAATLGKPFGEAIEKIASMKEIGRIIVSGMGKGGIIGMKISATLASIGVPSFFLHPAEAVHGDLGRYTKNDIALLLSNSGETQEVLELLPFLKRVGCPVIAITAHSDSTLGRNADVALTIGKHKEAGPLGLAPTTTTTAMLALGDALAMALVEERGLSETEFAGFHPAGSLGRSLLSVSEIMRIGEELCIVSPETLCKEVLHKITNTRGRPGAAVVADDNGVLCGIFTDGDLRRCLDTHKDFLNQPVREFMGKTPKSVSEKTLVREATELMNEKRIDQLVVVNEENKPVGLVDIQDAVSVRLK